jgi:hypothetical protein
MNNIKFLFSNLSDYIDKKPIVGVLILIIFTGSCSLLIFNTGKNVGEFFYSLKN